MCRDEECWRQQGQLEALLPSVHHDCPCTEGQGGGVVSTVWADVVHWLHATQVIFNFFIKECCAFSSFKENTYYRPSLVQPARVIYSVPGKRLVKGTGSSFSCVLTICTRNNTRLTLNISEELLSKWLSSWHWTSTHFAEIVCPDFCYFESNIRILATWIQAKQSYRPKYKHTINF